MAGDRLRQPAFEIFRSFDSSVQGRQRTLASKKVTP